MKKINLDKLKALIEINSYSTNRKGINRKLDFIEKELEDLPLEFKRTSNDIYGDFMMIRCTENDSEKPMIGLVFHTDTVHKPSTEFPIKIQDNMLFGPGAQDMQSSMYVMIEVLEELSRNNSLQNVVVILNSCEEKGSPEFQSEFKAISKELDYALVFESGTNGKISDDNEVGKSDFVLADSRKGIFQQVISTYGPGGHSGELSRQEERKNAIIQATKMINKIEQLEDYEKETTINMAFIEGGQENTTIAEHCRFVFDARFRFESERQRLKKEISKILDIQFVPGVEVIDQGYNYDLPSLQPNENSDEFFKEVKEIVLNYNKSVNADQEIKVSRAARGGWSDGCNMYEYNPDLKVLDGFGPRGGGEHSKNEFVYLDSINKSIVLTREVIQNILS